jgi:DNA-binding NarL/FixJ family response regulator
MSLQKDSDQEAIVRALNRRAVSRALSKYVCIRLRSEKGALSERSLVWMIDADRALSTLEPQERDVLLAREYGFSIPEIALALHMNQQRAERHVARATRKMTQAFVARGCIRDLQVNYTD